MTPDMTDELETLWCARCGRPAKVRPESMHFSRSLPRCCGVRDWCESQDAAEAAMKAAANRQPERPDLSAWRRRHELRRSNAARPIPSGKQYERKPKHEQEQDKRDE